MAASPKFKVYNPGGEYVAACKYAEDAAAIVASYGPGATIRLDHKRVVYREDQRGIAGESYDRAAEITEYNVREGVDLRKTEDVG